MDGKAILFLILLGAMCAVLLLLVRRVYRPGRKDELENPKHRMLDD